MSMKAQGKNITLLKISTEQNQWFRELASVYKHVTPNGTKIEYYSPYGEHLVEVCNEM